MLRNLDRLPQVIPLLALDLRLHVRVTDIDVRMRQKVEFPVTDWRHLHRLLENRLASSFHGHRQGLLLIDRGHQQAGGAHPKLESHRHGVQVTHLQ